MSTIKSEYAGARDIRFSDPSQKYSWETVTILGHGGAIYKDVSELATTLAAAPDLLAVCNETLAYLHANMPKGNIRNSDHFSALNHHAAMCKALHTAIAQAESK